MACGDTGDVNVFSSRVGFNDHLPSQPQATSLLTFADMVLALDNRVVCRDDIVTNATNREKTLQEDHTYASNKSHKMTTRSQAMRVNSHCHKLHDKRRHLEQYDVKNDKTEECLSNSDPGGMTHISDQDLFHSSRVHKYETPIEFQIESSTLKLHQEMDRKVKRSSSVENITTESITIDTCSEWPQTCRKNSPRKSCSFEEVNKNTVSQKSEEKRKGGSSGQLHRLVNDTLEFPCWPRKADHTYATATWDGTAASHSLFEQELKLSQEAMTTEDLEMEVTEAYILPLRKRSLNSHFEEQHRNVYAQQNHTYQKEDHTYVKQNTNANPPSNNISSFDSDTFRKSGYFCSTFPRQKTREDHTYFSSGLTKHGSCSSGGKDWNSAHTVSNLSQSKERTDSSGRNMVPQFLSAKKDHNYFTSA